MKNFLDRIGNNKFLIILAIILQIVVIVLIINPLSIIAQNSLNSVLNEVVNLANDPDFRNASIVKISDAEAFKKQYLLDAKYSDLKNNDYVFLVNDKFIIYRSDEHKIVFQGVAPASLLDVTRLENIIMTLAVEQKVITNSEQPAIKIYNAEIDKDNYADYFENLKDGDVMVFFAQNKIVLLYNLESNTIQDSKTFSVN